MNPHFFTSPFYFAFIWFRVQGSRGGFAAIIYGAMPDQESFSPLPLEGADERSESKLGRGRANIASLPISGALHPLFPAEGERPNNKQPSTKASCQKHGAFCMPKFKTNHI